MSRPDLRLILQQPEDLAREIDRFVPLNTTSIQFRADLAGLLVVSMASSYETCVKETLNNYAAKHHPQFAAFTQNNYDKLNSKINLNDLYKLARTFDKDVHSRFGQLIKLRKKRIMDKLGRDITSSYGQVLSWRHDFAHAGIRNTTIDEAIRTHHYAKRVLYAFNEAFDA